MPYDGGGTDCGGIDRISGEDLLLLSRWLPGQVCPDSREIFERRQRERRAFDGVACAAKDGGRARRETRAGYDSGPWDDLLILCGKD